MTALPAVLSDVKKAGGLPTCSTCKWFAKLSPGHAAICFEQWRGLPWNAAVPLTTADGFCDKHILHQEGGE